MQFGAYQLLRKLAIGGQAEIFLARQNQHGGVARQDNPVAAFGAEALLWDLGWEVVLGIPLTAAVLEVAIALSGSKVGRKGTASLTD